MPNHAPQADALSVLLGTVLHFVRTDKPDLTSRQTAVLLATYLIDEPQTVRGLAKALNVSKPAITRALDKLTFVGYLRRSEDPSDLRSVIVQRTPKGTAIVAEYRKIFGRELQTLGVTPRAANDTSRGGRSVRNPAAAGPQRD